MLGVADRLRAAIPKGGLTVTVRIEHPKLKTDKQGNPYPPVVVSKASYEYELKALGWRLVKAKKESDA